MPAAATAKVAKPKIIDYTKMELGRVTRTYKGRTVGVIARCRKCGKRGERGLSMPEKDERVMGRRPYVSVTHVLEIKSWGETSGHVRALLGSSYGYVRESCSIHVDATNVDDLLNVPERKEYDAWVAALRAYVEQF